MLRLVLPVAVAEAVVEPLAVIHTAETAQIIRLVRQPRHRVLAAEEAAEITEAIRPRKLVPLEGMESSIFVLITRMNKETDDGLSADH